MFKLVMMLPEQFRSEIAKQMIVSKNFVTLIQDGIQMLPVETDMLSFFGLFVVQKLGLRVCYVISNVFDAALSLKKPAFYDSLAKHFFKNPPILNSYALSVGIDTFLKKLEPFPRKVIGNLLVLLLQPGSQYADNFRYFFEFIAKVSEYLEKSKYTCSGSVVDAISRRILSGSYRICFYELIQVFEKILMKSEFLGTAEETPWLCDLLNSLTKYELTVPLAKCQRSHCRRSNKN
jgi:hypothetical protein